MKLFLVKTRNYYFFISLIVFLSCRTPLPEYLTSSKIRNDFNSMNQPVVFVPGIKGSILSDEKGNIFWLNASQALAFSNPDLRLVGDSINLKPMGALSRITVIPYIVEVPIYAPWLERMSNTENIDFYVFSYDWRKKNLDTRDQLIQFLESIGKKYKSKPVLIGHSMGGMLSFSAVNTNPTLVDKVIYVGVPFRGGIGYMKDLHVGVSTGLNSQIQSPCTIAKYETVYGFFPRLNSTDSKDVVKDSSGKSIDLDFYLESTWKDNSLGFYSHSCLAENVPNPIQFQENLNSAKKFRESLSPSSRLKKSPITTLVVHGKNYPTRKAMTLISDKYGEKNFAPKWDLEIYPKDEGDGSVLFRDSIPPIDIQFKSILSNNEHSVLLNDKNVQDKILEFIK